MSGRNVLCLRMDHQVRKVLPDMEDMDLVDLVDLYVILVVDSCSPRKTFVTASVPPAW